MYKQNVILEVARMGGSLYLVLTTQLKDIGAIESSKVMASWDGSEIVLKKVD
ncbi:MAG: hypothetical protein JRN68_06525 [Nitrososphaerota archaeon]|nr:hypothetical protein [Nitrososphaerota archaeon]